MFAGRLQQAAGDRLALGCFTDRHGGVSAAPYDSLDLARHVGDDPVAVGENRWAVAAELGLDPDRVVWMNQVHGDDVAVVREPPPGGEVPAVDGLVTDVRGLALAVLAADCAPLVLLAPAAGDAGVVGVAHAGRTGMQAGVVAAVVEAMTGLGAVPGDISAAVGPAVCGACYEVPAAMRDDVVASVPAAGSTTRWDSPGLDIPAGVAAQLAEAGIRSVTRSDRCTMEDADLFSHRGEGGRTGRLAGLAWLA